MSKGAPKPQEEPLERPREPSRALPYPWPFPYSIVGGRALRNRFWPPEEPPPRQKGAPRR